MGVKKVTRPIFCLKFIFASQGLYLVLFLAAAWIFNAANLLPLDSFGSRSFIGLVLTPDQQGQYFMEKKSYEKAADAFHTPVLKGAALFRDGRFKEAADVFSRHTSKVFLFNRGTALIMAGLYDEAIEILEKTLEADPGFKAARINLEIVKIRKQKKMPPEDDAGGTGGKLAADEFVFSDRKPAVDTDQTEQTDGGSDMGDAEMRSLWLRRLQSTPKDFLRVKFAYQHAKPKE